MKALKDSVVKTKIIREAERYLQERLDEITYSAVKDAAPSMAVEVEGMILFALSRHGYGAKRLREIHEWYKAIAEMPEIMGKQPKSSDCVQVVKDRYGLDIHDVNLRFVTFEQFMEDSKKEKGRDNDK